MSPVGSPHKVSTMRSSAPLQSQTTSPTRGLAVADGLILWVCWEWPDPRYLKRMRSQLTRQGIRAAVAQHNTPALFDWLIEVANYQGISDTIAWSYLEKDGRVLWRDIDGALQRALSCPKRASFE